MGFDVSEPLMVAVVQELAAAAGRGVRVYVAIDAYPFLIDLQPFRLGPLWFGSSLTDLKQPFRARFAALESIRQHGGMYAIINQPSSRFSLPQAGRSHIKAAIINNTVYVGGHNLCNPEEIDLMTFWQSTPAADYLYNFIRAAIKQGSIRQLLHEQDTVVPINKTDCLLIDAGVPRTSVILDEACRLIDEAEEWIYITSPYFPGGRTARHLQAAYRRGVRVQILFNHPHAHGLEAPAHHIHAWREQRRVPATFFEGRMPQASPKLHTKLLATDQGALLGSHNYVGQGVRLGTAELALLRKDPSFSTQAVAAMHKELRAVEL